VVNLGNGTFPVSINSSWGGSRVTTATRIGRRTASYAESTGQPSSPLMPAMPATKQIRSASIPRAFVAGYYSDSNGISHGFSAKSDGDIFSVRRSGNGANGTNPNRPFNDGGAYHGGRAPKCERSFKGGFVAIAQTGDTRRIRLCRVRPME